MPSWASAAVVPRRRMRYNASDAAEKSGTAKGTAHGGVRAEHKHGMH